MIRTFYDLSTGHLTAATRRLLDTTKMERWPVAGGRMPFGFFIYAHDEDSEGNIPADLWACIQLAHKHGADYILFDCDAELIEDLPSYDDEEPAKAIEPQCIPIRPCA
jgi:hypothetical protein